MRSQNIMYAKLRIKLFCVLGTAILFATVTVHAQTLAPGEAATTGDVGPGTSNIPANASATAVTSTSGALLRDGVFGCSASKYQNIGSLTALQGVYVPVNDAAVTINTGYLVYKECVLDGVVSAIKNDAVAGLQRQVIKAAETGRKGNAQYLKNFEKDFRPGFDAIVVNIVTGAKSSQMCNAFKSRVPTAVTRNYVSASRESASMLACPFAAETDREELVSGTAPINWRTWRSLIEPGGYEFSEYEILRGKANSAMAEYDFNTRQMLDWGRGVFSALDNNGNPLAQNVITPGYIIADSLSQMIGAGTNILINANEIDQVNGALQAGLSSTIVSDAIRGLSGLTKSQNGQPSYVDRMAAEASASVRAGAVNAAISILSAARQIETLYKQAKEATATALTNAITTLRGYETQCWALVVPKVREHASNSGASLDEAKIKSATTSLAFSQQIINSQIAPPASTTIRDLRASETALVLINQLIANVTNSSSAANQRTALEQLDSLVANNQLHSSQEATNAQKQKDDVMSAIGILLDDTKKAWGDSPDVNVGWCNINNQDVIVKWFNEWKN